MIGASQCRTLAVKKMESERNSLKVRSAARPTSRPSLDQFFCVPLDVT